MNITGNMSLTIWDELNDVFDYGQLEDNFIAIDTHDHSSEKGVQIGTNGLQNASVTQAKLAAGAVGTVNIQNFAVGNGQLAANSVTGDKVAPGSLTGSDLANGSIGFQQLDPTMFPMGWVTLWYRPAGSGATPGGVWEVMDGRAWNTITNTLGSGGTPLTTGNIPNMIGNFAMGTGLTSGVGIGNIGGQSAIDLYHAHNTSLPALSVPPHTHPISADGVHAHTFAGGFHLATRQNTIPPGRTMNLVGPNNSIIPVSDYTAFVNGMFAGIDGLLVAGGGAGAATTYPVDMDTAGIHSHGGNTGASSSGATGTSTAESDAQLSSSQDITNPYVGLCYIMRCR